jgi:hypothetical protein
MRRFGCLHHVADMGLHRVIVLGMTIRTSHGFH